MQGLIIMIKIIMNLLIYLFKDYIDDKYMTSDIKLNCRIGLIDSLLGYGQENYKNESYWNARENFEEVLNILNNYCEVRNRYINPPYKFTKHKLSEDLVGIAKENWKNTLNSMETSIDYLRKAKNIYNDVYNLEKYLRVTQLYYYLYKAYYESSSNRTSNLDISRKFKTDGHSFSAFNGLIGDEGIGDVNYLYNKSRNIDNLESQIGKKRNNIANLNYELNSINNNDKRKK